MNQLREILEEDILKRLAASAGLTEDQLLKAAGLLHIIQLLKSEKPSDIPSQLACLRAQRLKEELRQLLTFEKALPLSEVSQLLKCDGKEAEVAAAELTSKGEAYIVQHPKFGPIVAASSDGTLNLAELKDKDRGDLIINYHANRGKDVTYRQIYMLMKPALKEACFSEAEKRLLELLKTRPRRYIELVQEGVPKGQIYPALKKLMDRGMVRKVKRGKYAVA
jgi:hypothetical protein